MALVATEGTVLRWRLAQDRETGCVILARSLPGTVIWGYLTVTVDCRGRSQDHKGREGERQAEVHLESV